MVNNRTSRPADSHSGRLAAFLRRARGTDLRRSSRSRRSRTGVLLRRHFSGALGKARFTLLITLGADFYSQIITLDRDGSDCLAPAQVNIGALTHECPSTRVFSPGKARLLLAKKTMTIAAIPLTSETKRSLNLIIDPRSNKASRTRLLC